MTDVITGEASIPTPKREFRRQVAIALSLLLIVAAAVASLFIVQGVDTQIRDVQQTYEVRRQARELIQSIVDAETGQQVTQLLKQLSAERGHTVVVVTHDNRIFHYADRTVHIEDGLLTTEERP